MPQFKYTARNIAGKTIEGLIELEKGGLRVTLINAVIKTAGRARELMTG